MTDDENSERYDSDGYRWIGQFCGAWFFAVPLDSLRNEADVDRLVVKPLFRLITRETSEDVLGAIKDDLCLPPEHQREAPEAR